MKRLLCTVLTLCMLLCACGGAPEQTTVPTGTHPAPETTAPAVSPETTAPGADNDMSNQGQELPIPEDPGETVPSAEDTGNTVRIEDPGMMIYAGPSFVHDSLAMVEQAGAYTVVEETADRDGNTWGRLKSGAGWICLTDPALAPIYADYAEESFNAYHAYWSDEMDYITAIGFTPAEKLTDVKFGLLDWFETESWQMSEELYTMDELDPDRAFLAHVVFWGDMTTYGISFTDESGQPRHYAVSISGKDGSLVCAEYLP